MFERMMLALVHAPALLMRSSAGKSATPAVWTTGTGSPGGRSTDQHRVVRRRRVHGRQTMLRWRPTCLWLLIRGLVFGIGLATAACDGPMTTDSVNGLATSPSPLGPLPAGGSSAGSSNMLARELVSFPLLKGMFTITTQAGAQLVGTYVGEMIDPIHGRTSMTLQLTFTDGTGEFDGASGTLEAKGSVDTDDGTFVLSSFQGVVSTTAAPSGVMFRATVSGTSSLSCSAAGRIVLTLRGQGTGARAGRVDAELSGEIGNTECVD